MTLYWYGSSADPCRALLRRPPRPLQVLPGDEPGRRSRAPGALGAAEGAHRRRHRRLHPPGLVRRAAREARARRARALPPAPRDRARGRAPPAARLRTGRRGSCSRSRSRPSTRRGSARGRSTTCIYAASFETADRLRERLGAIGNLASDGRPILGLDSRHLLEITLASGPDAYLVPAHVWTPWFAVLGSKSGFDSVEECYGDLAPHIFAVETGLSSDPPMNWRVSRLDRFTLVSNSDAHSPPMLGREACGVRDGARLLRDPPRAGDRRGLRRHGRVLPRGGQVPPRRPPRLRRAAGAARDADARRPLPGLRQAADRGRHAPGRGAGRPARGPRRARRGRRRSAASCRCPRCSPSSTAWAPSRAGSRSPPRGWSPSSGRRSTSWSACRWKRSAGRPTGCSSRPSRGSAPGRCTATPGTTASTG